MTITKKMLERAAREAQRCFTPRFNKRVDHLKRMIRINAPPVILVGAAEMVCRERYGGHWGYFLHVTHDLLWRWAGALVWYCRAALWKVQEPRKSLDEIRTERYAAMVDEHNAECEEAGYPEFRA